jgi:hypothetical protein
MLLLLLIWRQLGNKQIKEREVDEKETACQEMESGCLVHKLGRIWTCNLPVK